MKINPNKFEVMLRLLSADKAIDPLRLNFAAKGVEICQTDRAAVIASIGRIDTTAFAIYEPIGSVTLNVSDILNKAPRMFKGEEEVAILVESPNIVFQGNYERFASTLSSEEVETKIAYTETPNGFVLSRPKITNIYSLDPANVEIGFGEFVRFKYEPNSLRMSIAGETFSYERKLKVLRAQGSDSGEAMLDVETLESIIGMFKGLFNLIFTEDGPLMISYKETNMSVTYAIAPRVI